MPAALAAGILGSAIYASLEYELRAELHGARIARCADPAIDTASDVQARDRRKVRVVEDIEDFPPQLN